MGRRILTAIFLLLGLVSGYITWLSVNAGDSGQWLFGVFTVFFLALAALPLLPKAKPKPEALGSTRFVPHWFMMLAVLVLVIAVLAAIVGAITHR